MLQRELYKSIANGEDLYRTYSDNEKKIQNVTTGVLYEDVVEPESSTTVYQETNADVSEGTMLQRLLNITG